MYDVIVIGSGPAGIFACYELMDKSPGLSVLLVDKGLDIDKRTCPIMAGKIHACPINEGKQSCMPACSITNGFGGAGAYSDGKFNITTLFGGWLGDYISDNYLRELICYVDSINLKHGATEEITDPITEEVRKIEQRASGAGLKLLRSQVRHLGTEANLEILKSINRHLSERIEMRFGTEAEDILVENGKVCGVVLRDGSELRAKSVVIVPGRDGSSWFTDLADRHGLSLVNNQVDIGVRVETSDVIMHDINKHLYEAKLVYSTSVGTLARTFCSNPSGHVVVENHSGIVCANGHAYKDPGKGSENTNFAILVSHKFTEPFNRPNEYAREICKRANELSNGSVILQRYGDIKRGRRSTKKRIGENFIKPTQTEAEPGDLGLALPYTTMKSVIEMIQALDNVTPGLESDHTLLYGVEAKFYSSRPELSGSLMTKIDSLYCGGDGAGITRGLAQAGASGVLIARDILNRS
ncbi:MAG: NAD(P)/FAD-dependent oxidoreductase [Defluviitaleaceae bacterium]|nr:NAD(P)/FAD-dependent oxidoreductase [Defluviitaleaceae bacterium]